MGIGRDALLATIVVYQMSASGWEGEVHMFEKPWFTTFLSTTTCSCCLLLLRMGFGSSFGRSVEVPQAAATDNDTLRPAVRHRSYSRQGAYSGGPLGKSTIPEEDGQDSLHAPLLGDGQADGNEDSLGRQRGAYGHVKASKVVKLVAPAVTGHFALILQGIGLQYTSASINQMVSGSCIVFTAMLSVALLKRRLTRLHMAGVALSMAGVVIVSVSSLLPINDHSTCEKQQPMWLTVAGIVITLISQIVQAVQLVLEELMLRDLHLHPFQVLGYEGIIGIAWMVLLAAPLLFFIPGMDVGSQENTLDTLIMLWNSPSLGISTAVYWWTVLGTNMFGVMVSATIGSVFRSVLLTARTALVWVVNLMLFYTGLGGGVVGESLNTWSGLEALGFVFLLSGTLLYARGSEKSEEAMEKAVLVAVEATFASGNAVVVVQRTPPRSPGIISPHSVRSPSGRAVPHCEGQPLGTSPGAQQALLLVRRVSGLDTLLQDSGDGLILDTSPEQIAENGGVMPPASYWIDPEAARTVVLEGLDSNRHIGSSSYFNPFIPRLPIGESQEVLEIMGTAIEPHQLGGTSISVSYIHTPLATSPSSRSRRPSVQGDPLSPSRGSLDGQTIVLLRSVRASLASSSGGPSADQQPQPEEISPATPAEEDEDCTFQMDGN